MHEFWLWIQIQKILRYLDPDSHLWSYTIRKHERGNCITDLFDFNEEGSPECGEDLLGEVSDRDKDLPLPDLELIHRDLLQTERLGRTLNTIVG